MATTPVFKGLQSIEEALNYKQVLVQEEKEAEKEAQSEEAVATIELHTLSSQAQLVPHGQKIGLAWYPVVLQKSFVSDSLQAGFKQFDLQFDWYFHQYRICKNAKMVGVSKEFQKDFIQYIAGKPFQDQECQNFVDNLLNNPESQYYNWAFIGKPTSSGEHLYYLIMPKQLINSNASFVINMWDFLEC